MLHRAATFCFPCTRSGRGEAGGYAAGHRARLPCAPSRSLDACLMALGWLASIGARAGWAPPRSRECSRSSQLGAGGAGVNEAIGELRRILNDLKALDTPYGRPAQDEPRAMALGSRELLIRRLVRGRAPQAPIHGRCSFEGDWSGPGVRRRGLGAGATVEATPPRGSPKPREGGRERLCFRACTAGSQRARPGKHPG